MNKKIAFYKCLAYQLKGKKSCVNKKSLVGLAPSYAGQTLHLKIAFLTTKFHLISCKPSRLEDIQISFYEKKIATFL